MCCKNDRMLSAGISNSSNKYLKFFVCKNLTPNMREFNAVNQQVFYSKLQCLYIYTEDLLRRSTEW